MRVKVEFTGNYKDLFGVEEKNVELRTGATLHELAEAICASKECYQAIFDESGRPKPGVGVEEKNGRKVKLLDAGNTKLSDNDKIILFHFVPE